MLKSQISVNHLTVAYNSTPIIQEMNVQIPKGKITVIIGPNGCGKSTLLKTIGRVLIPKTGMIALEGKDIHTLSTVEVAKKMAILPQSPQAPAGLTVGELVQYGRFPHRKGFKGTSTSDKVAIEWALRETNLLQCANTSVDTLSGGQRQRAWIAMAIAQQTETILLDEPTTYLDLSYQLEILELLYRLNRERKTTIVMVLHDLNLAARHADHMIALRHGKVIGEGSPAVIMQKSVLKETFNIDAEVIQDKRTGCPTCVSYDLIK